jgi:hypothetical protein
LARLAAQQAQNPAPVPVVRVAERERLEAERIAQAERERLEAERIAQVGREEAERVASVEPLARLEAEGVALQPQAQTRSEILLARHVAQQAQNPAPIPVAP